MELLGQLHVSFVAAGHVLRQNLFGLSLYESCINDVIDNCVSVGIDDRIFYYLDADNSFGSIGTIQSYGSNPSVKIHYYRRLFVTAEIAVLSHLVVQTRYLHRIYLIKACR